MLEGISAVSTEDNAWNIRISRAESNWADARQTLLSSMMEREVPNTDVCMNCGKNPTSIACNDCAPYCNFCVACDYALHQMNPFHNRKAFNGNCYVSLRARESFHNMQVITIGTPCCFTVKLGIDVNKSV